MPINIADLEYVAANGCQHPGCDHTNHNTFYLHAQCHPKALLEFSYTIGTGIMRVSCGECKKVVVDVIVSRRHHYDGYQLATLPLDMIQAEFEARIFDAANLLHFLEDQQRLRGDGTPDSIAKKFTQDAMKLLLQSYRPETEPTTDESSGTLLPNTDH